MNNAAIWVSIIQLISTTSIAILVYWRTGSNRKIDLVMAFDKEWHSDKMLEARYDLSKRMIAGKSVPEINDNDYVKCHMVRMFFARVGETRRSGLLDNTLLEALIGSDAGLFAEDIRLVWGDKWGASKDFKVTPWLTPATVGE